MLAAATIVTSIMARSHHSPRCSPMVISSLIPHPRCARYLTSSVALPAAGSSLREYDVDGEAVRMWHWKQVRIEASCHGEREEEGRREWRVESVGEV